MDASDRFRTVVVEAVRSNALTASADDKEMIDQSFEQLGFDSLTLMEFCIAIAAETGVNLPVAQVVPLKTPAAVIRFLADGRGGSKLATPQAGPRDGLVARVLAGLATASSASDYYRIQIEMAQLATGPETATARTSAVRAPPKTLPPIGKPPHQASGNPTPTPRHQIPSTVAARSRPRHKTKTPTARRKNLNPSCAMNRVTVSVCRSG